MNIMADAQAAFDAHNDPTLFGWDPTPGIVSIWAQRDGRATVWRRVDGQIICEQQRFRPWIFATSLDDLSHLGPRLAAEDTANSQRAAVVYRTLSQGTDTRHETREADNAYDQPSAFISQPSLSYGFLLYARDGRMLERAILTGASKRLGRRVGSLYELDESYYRVGPVEQYLMASGRVYFRGLVYDDLHRLQFDLETTALDPHQGRIFLIVVSDNRGLRRLLEAPDPADEAHAIAELCRLIVERDPDVIENHNLFGFDMPFLAQRADTLGVPLSLGRAGGPRLLERYPDPFARNRSDSDQMRYSVPGRELIDTLDAVRRHDFVARDLPSHRLKDVARHFGIASEDRTYLDGAAIYATYRSNPDEVRRYALDDVAEVDGLSQRLLGAAFALAGMAPRRYERISSAGPAMGILEPMLVRAYLHAGAALPWGAGAGLNDAPHAGGALHLFAAGVATHVVKADIASLYPSLMRRERIGPNCDQLGALLHIVDRLTELRLAHKAAARTAQPDSLEKGHHNAMQAAMKLIINAAYGYMGAGQMALFADRNAADSVTARGREVLGHVVDALRAQGVALIEADTDGVYFAVPAHWQEADERAMVEQVASTLPDGLRLEYDGRYAAMFSHEVKNYALLTYSGELIMRGVALRSSRSEPFGNAFLRKAMICTMRGDIVGLRDCFDETVAAIRNRELTPDDMASRMRLSKTPETYAASRSSRQEAPYEALIAAGRTRWSPGERIRCYRAQDGRSVWLPDSTEHQSEQDRSKPLPEYDIDHYLSVLVGSYASRLRKAFEPEDFEQIFRVDEQISLFDQPIDAIQPRWITCEQKRT